MTEKGHNRNAFTMFELVQGREGIRSLRLRIICILEYVQKAQIHLFAKKYETQWWSGKGGGEMFEEAVKQKPEESKLFTVLKHHCQWIFDCCAKIWPVMNCIFISYFRLTKKTKGFIQIYRDTLSTDECMNNLNCSWLTMLLFATTATHTELCK